jgi:hypothetical protein
LPADQLFPATSLARALVSTNGVISR